MLELSDRKWAEFKLTDVFDISQGKKWITKAEIEENPGNIPLVSCSGTNNGIMGFVNPDGIKKCTVVKNKLTVAVSGSAGATFYQGDTTVVNNGVLILSGKQFTSKSAYMFMCTIIGEACKKFNYGMKASQDRVSTLMIILPVNDAGQPDYDFMEQYIAERLPDYSWAKGCIEPDAEISLSDRKWAEFKLTDLFDIRAGKRIPSPDSGCTPYVTAGTSNNGVTDYISDKPNFKGNCITIGKVGCDAFYQPIDFCATNDVTILVPFSNQFNKFTGLFISNVINFGEKGKWNYGNQCRVNDCKRIVISLPIKADGTPDYDFMERYMKSLPFSKVLE